MKPVLARLVVLGTPGVRARALSNAYFNHVSRAPEQAHPKVRDVHAGHALDALLVVVNEDGGLANEPVGEHPLFQMRALVRRAREHDLVGCDVNPDLVQGVQRADDVFGAASGDEHDAFGSPHRLEQNLGVEEEERALGPVVANDRLVNV